MTINKDRTTNAEIIDALKILFPHMNETQGKILWGNVINKDVSMPNGKDAGSSFRRWGRIIADVTGEGDYLTYYMAYGMLQHVFKTLGIKDAFDLMEQEILETLKEAGWTITEMTISD